MDSEIPPEVRALTYKERVMWHKRRVSKELPVFDFLDSITDEEKTVVELREELSELKVAIRKTEIQVALFEYDGGRFTRLINDLAYHTAMARTTGGEIKKLHLENLKTIETEIGRICKELGTDGSVYKRSQEFEERFSGNLLAYKRR
jgi:hypothetical protein